MSSSNPPELPKLPPIRASAEHVVPPPGDEASFEDWASEAVEQSPESAQPATTAAERSEARRRSPRKPRREEKRDTPKEAPQVVLDPPGGGGRGGRGSRTEDGRRYSTAGHGLIVALLGLVFGALLLAPGMHKSAFNGQPGAKRDV